MGSVYIKNNHIIMMDYYGSIIQSKEDIYKDITSRFSKYDKDYIKSKIDTLYETHFINEQVSLSGWLVFVGPEVVSEVITMIQQDIIKANRRLLLAKCLIPREDCNHDLLESISQKI